MKLTGDLIPLENQKKNGVIKIQMFDLIWTPQ